MSYLCRGPQDSYGKQAISQEPAECAGELRKEFQHCLKMWRVDWYYAAECDRNMTLCEPTLYIVLDQSHLSLENMSALRWCTDALNERSNRQNPSASVQMSGIRCTTKPTILIKDRGDVLARGVFATMDFPDNVAHQRAMIRSSFSHRRCWNLSPPSASKKKSFRNAKRRSQSLGSTSTR